MSRPLNILLFAFGHAGVNAIRSLRRAGHHITGCFTHPTMQSWIPSIEDECRRQSVLCSTIAPYAQSITGRPDVVLSVFYRRKIDSAVLNCASLGVFNIAASQLPRYRGYFPYRWAIINNESIWGVTVHQMTDNYCDGAVLHRRPLVLKPQENAYELSLRIADAADAATMEAVAKLSAGNIHLTAADPTGAQFFGHDIPYGGAIDWHQSAARIDSFIRALDFGRQVKETYQHLAAPAAARIGGETMGIYRAHFGGTMSSYPPGTLTRCDNQVWVQTARGHLVIERVVADGKDYEAARYFASRGFASGDRFDVAHAWVPQTQGRQLVDAA
jgi:methionyl-tRNA formyltransferase